MEVPVIQHRVLSLPRDAGREDEYEDASAVQTEQWPACAAVADGATEAAFSGLWAGILADGVAAEGLTDPAFFTDAVPRWQNEWKNRVDATSRDRPWYVKAKLEDGAYATVLSLRLEPDGNWRALSIGDCCLFHVRNGHYRDRWPYNDVDDFDHRPNLVPSRIGRPVPFPDTTGGTWSTGDTFALATDAMAEWLIRTERSPLPSGSETFEQDVADARRSGALPADDVTLVVLELADTEADTSGD